MAAGLAKRHMNRTRDGQLVTAQAIDPVPSTRKRPRPVTNANNNGKSEDDLGESSQQCKRVKVRTKPQELPQSEVQEALPPSLRRSPRLRKLQESRNQLSPREQKPTERSSAATQHQGWKSAQTQKKASARLHKAKRQGFWKQGNTQRSPLNSLTVWRDKHQRSSVSGDQLHRVSKQKRRQSVSGLSVEQADSIERWLDESYRDQDPSIVDKVLEAKEAMPRKPGAVLPSPVDSFDRNTTSSRKSERTTASVKDSDYRQVLRHHNVNIERENAPTELMRRAHRIISRRRASPEMDDVTVEELKQKSRQLQEDAEEEIVQLIAPSIIPAMKRLPDERLARNADQQWANSVPVPLDPDVLASPLPLPKPKPDLAFGYSQNAFNHKQLMTIDLLVDDQFGRSFAQPDQKLRFPFLCVEFKSQAKGGTHYVATNQAAGAGAVALRGVMELTDRSFGMKSFNYEEPQFFSVTMDHESARINVHWLKAPVNRGVHGFHVEGLSQHLLKDDDGIRALARAIKNILDEGTDKRLRTLCEALDAYRAIVIRNREAADPRKVRHEAQTEVQGGPGERIRKLALEETTTKSMQPAPLPREASAVERIADPRKVKQSLGSHNIGRTKSTGAPTPISRHSAGSAGKNAYNVAPRLDTTSRHTIAEDETKSKRQIRPSRKLLESRKHMIASQGVKPRSRHEL